MFKMPFLLFFSSFFKSSKYYLYAIVIIVIAGLFVSLKFSEGNLEKQKLQSDLVISEKNAVIANDVAEAKKLFEVSESNKKSVEIISKSNIQKEKFSLNAIKKANQVKNTINDIKHKIIVEDTKHELSDINKDILLSLSEKLDSQITTL